MIPTQRRTNYMFPFLFVASLALCGCGHGENEYSWNYIMRHKDEIHKGMSQEEIVKILGEPRDRNNDIMEYTKSGWGLAYDVFEIRFAGDVVDSTLHYSD